jgi:hypothetical protein
MKSSKTRNKKGDIIISLSEIIRVEDKQVYAKHVHSWLFSRPEYPYAKYDAAEEEALEFFPTLKWDIYSDRMPYESAIHHALSFSTPDEESMPKVIHVPRYVAQLAGEQRRRLKATGELPKPLVLTAKVVLAEPEHPSPHDKILELLRITRVRRGRWSGKQLARHVFDSTWPTAELVRVIGKSWNDHLEEFPDPTDYALAEALAMKYSKPNSIPPRIKVPSVVHELWKIHQADEVARDREWQERMKARAKRGSLRRRR